MEQPKQPSVDQLQKTIYSLQKQLSEYIGKYTDNDVNRISLLEENEELKKELEEYRKKEIKEMDKGGKDNAKKQ